MSGPQLPVIRAWAPDALIFVTYGEKSLTLPRGISSSPTTFTSGRSLARKVFTSRCTDWPNR